MSSDTKTCWKPSWPRIACGWLVVSIVAGVIAALGKDWYAEKGGYYFDGPWTYIGILFLFVSVACIAIKILLFLIFIVSIQRFFGSSIILYVVCALLFQVLVFSISHLWVGNFLIFVVHGLNFGQMVILRPVPIFLWLEVSLILWLISFRK